MTTFNLASNNTLYVTTLEDQNDGGERNGLSLRDATLIANANPGKSYTIYIIPELIDPDNPDQVTLELTRKNVILPPTVDDQNIDLPTLIESRRYTGDLDITGTVTIIGANFANNSIPTGLSNTASQEEIRQIINEEDLVSANPQDIVIDAFGLLGDFKDSVGRRVGDRIFEVEGGANLSVNNMSIQNGVIRKEIILTINEDTTIVIPGNTETIQQGGAVNIQLGGTATFNNSIIGNSLSDLEGGGINNQGNLTLNNTVVINNQAGSVQVDGTANPTLGGGGIYNQGLLSINRSAILGNIFVRTGFDLDGGTDIGDLFPDLGEDVIEGGGAGILNETGATLIIVNSTISGNSSREEAGGGILSRGIATIINSTIADNIAQDGSGFFGETTNSNNLLINTIIANNRFGEIVTVFNDDSFFNTFINTNTTPVTVTIDPLLFDANGNQIFDTFTGQTEILPPEFPDYLDFQFFNGQIFIEKSDPFANNRRENITNSVSVENLVFDGTGQLTFVFDTVDFDSDLEGDNLIYNQDQNFTFAYQSTFGTEIYLDSYFDTDDNGNTILILTDPTIDPADNFEEDIFVADRTGEFEFSPSVGNPLTDNRLIVNENNVDQVPYVYDRNNVRIQDADIVEIDVIPFADGDSRNTTPDIDGFFNPSSSYNLIGITNGILDGTNNNLAGSSSSPLDPMLGSLQSNGGTTPYYPILIDSPAFNAGRTDFIELTGFFNNSRDANGNVIDQRGGLRVVAGLADIGSFELQESEIQSQSNISSSNSDSLLNDPLIRFQNTQERGTYLFAGEQESANIRANYANSFAEEGFAFNVSFTPNDELIAMYRFQNMQKTGTYLYVTEGERQNVLTNYGNVFAEEGLAFYVYGADANKGNDIFRLQNQDHPGTYIFVGEQEKNNILANYSNFSLEGVAFEV